MKKNSSEAYGSLEHKDTYMNTISKFKKIDDIVKYITSKNVKWFKVFKFQRLDAKQAKGGEEIETIGSDGNIETKRIAKKGDWIVNNISNKDNKWIIDDKTFKKKYEKEKDGIYKPKGGEMLAAKVSDYEDSGVEFAPPNWGGDVIKIKNDGYFMKDPSNKNDIYAISKKDFDSTYKSTLNESDDDKTQDDDKKKESNIVKFIKDAFNNYAADKAGDLLDELFLGNFKDAVIDIYKS